MRDASLPAACRRFRAQHGGKGGFEDRDLHRLDCADCAAWAIHKSAVHSARAARRRLPEALAQRLRAIPSRGTGCPADDALMRIARNRAHGRGLAADAGHLDRCPRCRRLAAVLESAFVMGPSRMPASLHRRLRRMGYPRRRGLVWEFDLKVASFAAALVGLLLVPVAGPTAALARQAGSAFTEPIDGLRTASPARIGALTTPVRERLGRAAGRLRTVADTYTDSWLDLADRTQTVWRLWREPEAEVAHDQPGSGGQDDDD